MFDIDILITNIYFHTYLQLLCFDFIVTLFN